MNKLLLISIILFSFFYISAQDLYDIDKITKIELIFENSNWNDILIQNKLEDQGKRLLATAIINGIRFDSVGVRYKGNSTFRPNYPKNPLNIKLDYIINQDYNGYETLKLSSGSHDPSFIREVLSYEIARKYMIAPHSNYAKVFINGKFHGLYSSSESIDSDFGQRYLYADKNNIRIKCNSDDNSNHKGAALEYFGNDSTAYFGAYTIKSDFGWNELTNLIDILSNNPTEIESILDIDKAIWMIAFNNVLVNLDSYSGRKANYYLLKDNSDIFNPVVWDMNESLGGFELIGPGPPSLQKLIYLPVDLQKGRKSYPLIKLIFDNDKYRKMYFAHCKTILEENFANNWYKTRGLELQNFIDNEIQQDPNALYSYDDFTKNMTSTIQKSQTIQGLQGAYGITELFDKRTLFLNNQTEYKKISPTVTEINHKPEIIKQNTTFTITSKIKNANKVFLYYRYLISDKFEVLSMFDDGNHNDELANDGIYGTTIKTNSNTFQYYIYSENEDAGIFSPKRAAHDYYSIKIKQEIANVVVNEFIADNKSSGFDQDEEFDDWIELYNNTEEDISLKGYFLSDNYDDITKWIFPDTFIKANNYLIIWADKDTDQKGLHSNFKLSKNGEELIFSDPSASVIDHIVFGKQNPDISMGRYPNGTGEFTDLLPSFSSENKFLSKTKDLFLNNYDVRIFPNPTTGKFSILCDEKIIENIAIYDILGNKVFQDKSNTIIDLDGSKGIYIVTFQIEDKTIVKKIVVK